MSEDKKPMFKVTIDDISVEVEAGTTVLEAARRIAGTLSRLQCVSIPNLKEAVENAGLVWWRLRKVLRRTQGQYPNCR